MIYDLENNKYLFNFTSNKDKGYAKLINLNSSGQTTFPGDDAVCSVRHNQKFTLYRYNIFITE